LRDELGTGTVRRLGQRCNLTVTYLVCYERTVDAVLQALSDPSRRTVLDALSEGPATASELAALLPITRPGASRHLRVLRDAGLVEVHQKAQFRIYSLRPGPLAELDEWLDRYRSLWTQRMDALHTEIVRGKRERRSEL
jgi:DNA-binding transcriptional ArsR family regulator